MNFKQNLQTIQSDPFLAVKHDQLLELDLEFDLFTTRCIPVDKLLENENEIQQEEILTFLIEQLGEFQTQQNKKQFEEFQQNLKSVQYLYQSQNPLDPKKFSAEFKHIFEANKCDVANNFRKNMNLNELVQKESLNRIFSQVPIFVIDQKDGQIVVPDSQRQPIINYHLGVQQFTLQYKSQILVTNYFCSNRLDKYVKILKNIINKSTSVNSLMKKVKIEQESESLNTKSLNTKEKIPQSWDDDENKSPTIQKKASKRRSKTPLSGQTTKVLQFPPTLENRAKSPTIPKGSSKRAQKQIKKINLTTDLNQEAQVLNQFEKDREFEKRKLLQKAEEMRKKQEIEKAKKVTSKKEVEKEEVSDNSEMSYQSQSGKEDEQSEENDEDGEMIENS